MKLKECFVTHDMSGEQVMVSTDTMLFSGLVRSNKTAAAIVDCLQTETTKEQIVDTLLQKYEVDKERLSNDVNIILSKLKKIGALED